MCKDEIRALQRDIREIKTHMARQDEFTTFRDNHFKHFEGYVRDKLDLLDNKINNKATIIAAVATIILIILK